MRRSLHGILRRVEQLAMTTKMAACTGKHRNMAVLFVHNDDPIPDLPTYPDECACDAAETCRPIIHRIIHELPDERETE